ncbi:Serine/threonine-protein kinase [Venturia nashicola]|nr:Serine/threonine-protein kinase [Venturia nashicola]
MPLCTLYLLSLTLTTTIPSFLSSLRSASLIPIVQSKVIRWIILPKSLSAVPLLAHNTHWDLLILLPGTSSLPISISSQVAAAWHVTVGIPSRLLEGFGAKNNGLLNPPSGSVKPAEKPDQTEASSTQNLELTPELASWIDSLPSAQRNHPISMLNLLSFFPGKKKEYLKYGAAFAKAIGSRHGGEAKIVGNVIHPENETSKINADASANGAAAAGYMLPGQAVSKSSTKSREKGTSASGASASGLMVEDEAMSKSKDTRSGLDVSVSKAHTVGYNIPDEAQNQSSTAAQSKATNPDASAACSMIPNSSSISGASASSSSLMVETELSASSPSLNTSSSQQDHGTGWDEIAIAHYPSLHHFAAMAGSKDYQSVNHKHRVPSLRDTFIVCTMEIGDDGELAGRRKGGGLKL